MLNTFFIVLLLACIPEQLLGRTLVKRSNQDGGIIFHPEEDRLWECLDKMKLYWPPTDSCFATGKRGPCPENQWIVAKANTWEEEIPRAECRPRPCSNESESLWLPDNKCYPKVSPDYTLDTRVLPLNSTPAFHPCPSSLGLSLVDDPYGLGACECSHSTDVQVFWNLTGRCYPIYQQGPCSPGEYLVYENHSDAINFGDGYGYDYDYDNVPEPAASRIQCKPNPCPGDKVPFEGKCYSLKSEEPCTIASDFLDVNKNTLKLECLSGTRQLGSIAPRTSFCARGSVQDIIGRCKVRY